MKNFEEMLTDSIKKSLLDKADKLIESEITKIRQKLWEEATNEINRITNLIVATSFDNTATMTREIHISLKR
jgi:hypothetical protein